MSWERVRTHWTPHLSHTTTQVTCRSWCPSQIHVRGFCPESWEAEVRDPTRVRGAGVPTKVQGQQIGLERSPHGAAAVLGGPDKPSEWYGCCFASSPRLHAVSLGVNVDPDKERNSRNGTSRLAKLTQNHTDCGHHPSETGLTDWSSQINSEVREVPDFGKRRETGTTE